jgi:hypothetical protein
MFSRNCCSTLKEVKYGVPQETILGLWLFLFYMNGLAKVVNDKSIPILFADGTSILVTSTNKNHFQTNNYKL